MIDKEQLVKLLEVLTEVAARHEVIDFNWRHNLEVVQLPPQEGDTFVRHGETGKRRAILDVTYQVREES